MRNIAQLRHLVARIEGKIVAPFAACGDQANAPTIRPLANGYFCFGHEEVDSIAGPFPSHALHEVMAMTPVAMNIATGFCLGLLTRCQTKGKPFIWLEDEMTGIEYGTPYPIGIASFGLDPAQFILVRCKSDAEALKATDDALSEKCIGGIILSLSCASKALNFTATRRLHLGAEKARCPTILLLGKNALKTSNATTRWQIAATSSESSGAKAPGFAAFDVRLLRNRTGNTGHWLMQWNLNDKTFTKLQAKQTTKSALSGTRFSTFTNRSPQDGFAA